MIIPALTAPKSYGLIGSAVPFTADAQRALVLAGKVLQILGTIPTGQLDPTAME